MSGQGRCPCCHEPYDRTDERLRAALAELLYILDAGRWPPINDPQAEGVVDKCRALATQEGAGGWGGDWGDHYCGPACKDGCIRPEEGVGE